MKPRKLTKVERERFEPLTANLFGIFDYGDMLPERLVSLSVPDVVILTGESWDSEDGQEKRTGYIISGRDFALDLSINSDMCSVVWESYTLQSCAGSVTSMFDACRRMNDDPRFLQEAPMQDGWQGKYRWRFDCDEKCLAIELAESLQALGVSDIKRVGYFVYVHDDAIVYAKMVNKLDHNARDAADGPAPWPL